MTTYREKRYYVDDVFSMLVKSYQNVEGGLIYKDKETLLSKHGNVWKLIYTDKSEHPQVVIIYKYTEFGKKICACGCTQTKESKRILLEEFHEDLKRGEIYSEVSDKIERWLEHCGIEKIPFEQTKRILKGKHLIPLEDGYHYKREIQGIIKTKVIYGKIQESKSR